MFMMFPAARPNNQVPTPKDKLSLVLAKIKVKHPELTEGECQNLESILRDRDKAQALRDNAAALLDQCIAGKIKMHEIPPAPYDVDLRLKHADKDSPFHCIATLPRAADYESKYGIVEEILDYVKENDPKNYFEILEIAYISHLMDACLIRHHNKFAPFIETLLKQVKNISSDDFPIRYLEMIVFVLRECYRVQWKLKDKIIIAPAEGNASHLSLLEIEESIEKSITLIAEFFVRIIRCVYNLEDMTVEQSIRDFLCHYVPNDDEGLSKWDLDLMVERLSLEWASQHQRYPAPLNMSELERGTFMAGIALVPGMEGFECSESEAENDEDVEMEAEESNERARTTRTRS